jgi:sn-glycerol 3-phosphate transport system substrate-binding protein
MRMLVKRFPRFAAVCLATTSGLTALSLSTASPPAGASAKLASCPLAALKAAKGTVTIDFWNSMVRANGQTLTTLTNAFNASQTKVHVDLVVQPSYDDTWQKYEAGLSNGQVPAVVQLEDQRTQEAMDTGSILPVQSCINATHYATSDFLAQPLNYWKVDGVQEAMPFAVSNPVLYYNKLAFVKAGLNPNDPPATLPQFLADAKALKASGSGTGLKTDPWHLETWLATANGLFVNHNNGRTGRATAVQFDSKLGLQIFTELDQLVKSGDAVTNPSSGPDDFDNLLGIGNGKYGMSIDTSAALGTITEVLNGGSYPNVQLGVGPFPVLSASIKGGIEPGGSGIYISNKVPPAQQAAAWQYIAFLESTSSVATWAAGTGYIPVRQSSTKTATIQKLWQQYPGYKVAYTQLNNGVHDIATAGSVIGPYIDVRTAIQTAEISMYTQGVSPAAALAAARAGANAALKSYNSRL